MLGKRSESTLSRFTQLSFSRLVASQLRGLNIRQAPHKLQPKMGIMTERRRQFPPSLWRFARTSPIKIIIF
jgi:hypothetical protein